MRDWAGIAAQVFPTPKHSCTRPNIFSYVHAVENMSLVGAGHCGWRAGPLHFCSFPIALHSQNHCALNWEESSRLSKSTSKGLRCSRKEALMTKDDTCQCSGPCSAASSDPMSPTRSEVGLMTSPESLKALVTHIHLSYIIKQIYNACNIFY